MSGQTDLAEITCGGGAFLDYDQDGDLDVYVSQGHMLGPGGIGDASMAPAHPLPLTDRLYRNDLEPRTGGQPALRFVDVTDEAGLAAGGAAEASGYGCGVATGDYDNDGRTDLLALNLGGNRLFRNQGAGADGRVAFRDVTSETARGLLAERASVGAAFFDFDRDGWLDLFVVNYVTFDPASPERCFDQTGAPDYCGPAAYSPEPDQLFRNLGRDAGGKVAFEEVTAAAGLAASAAPGLGLVTGDFNGDGWSDVYVANDGEPNRLWINRRDGTFTDEAVLAGCSVNGSGEAEASMGVDAGDVDGDGDLDLFLTHLIRQTNTLYLNDGRAFFEDRTLGSGLGPASLAYTSFGTAFFDYDNDGRLDLWVANGAVTKLPALVAAGDPLPLHQPNQLFRNLGQDGGAVRFADATAAAGAAFELSEVSRGSAFGDVDNDGDGDVLVVNNGGPLRLMVNEIGQDKPWLGLRLVDGDPPRDQLGARVALLRDGEPRLWRRVRVDGGYSSAHDPRVLFGLGDDPRFDGVRVEWPDGTVEEWTDIAAGAYTTLARGIGPSSSAAGGPAGDLTSGEAFVDRTRESGLGFVHFNGMSGEHSIVEEMGSGGALFDYDNDGDLDLYLVQGHMLGRGKEVGEALFPPRHPLPLSDRLYRNDLEQGALGFTDVTVESGLAEIALGYGMGVAAGDYDNDGWTDLYVTNHGPNQLLRNRGRDAAGRVTFADATGPTLTQDGRFSVPAVFFDYDRDGWLDLWVGNYVEYPEDEAPVCRDATGAQDYCGPDVFRPQPDRLFRNRGRGPGGVTFEDVTAEAGLAAAFGPALGVVAADLDGDGRPDLYVANDGHPNHLWLQQEDGTFVDDAVLAGAALNADGRAEASMGVDAADFDGDGDFDLFLTHFVTETNTLFLNDGRGLFDDATTASGLGPPSRVYTSFGTGALDYDLDGREDLLVVNGAVNRIEALARRGDPYPLHQPNQLFRNVGGRFEEVTAAAGRAFETSEVSRGAVFGDVDNDGDTDVVVVNNSGPARLLINEAGQGRHWLGVRLVGGPGAAPRDMLGARAALLRGGRPVLWRRLRADGSYASASDPRVLFGLGPDASIDGVRVVWPDGTVEDFPDLPVDRYTTLRQRNPG